MAHFAKPGGPGETHKKGLSLNLNLGVLPQRSAEVDSELFSFRKDKDPEPKYGEFYRRLKMEL